MKKTELKKVLKPLIKECVKEIIFEDGVLSSIIAEVITGVVGAPPILNAAPPKIQEAQENKRHAKAEAERRNKMKETRKKMLNAIGESSYNGVDLFEGTKPMTVPSGEQHDPLSGTDPTDAGIDISSLMENTSTWKTLAGNNK
jgi:hypothetical protein